MMHASPQSTLPAISPGSTATHERRTAPRVDADWAVKLSGPGGGLRYRAGRTRNLSAGGALLRLEAWPASLGGGQLRPGQRVRLGVADPAEVARPGVIAAERMIEATVLRRIVNHDGAEEVAVRFHRPMG